MDRTNAARAVNDDGLPDGHEEGTPQGHPSDRDETPEEREFAKRLGWIAEEEWDDATMVRKPKAFLSARDYIKKVENTLPILRKTLREQDRVNLDLRTRFDAATEELRGTRSQLTELGELVEALHTQNVETGKRAYEKAKRELQERIDAAARESDPDTVRQLTSELVDLERQKPADAPQRRKPEEQEGKKPPAKPAVPELSAAAKSWIENNARIMNDPILNPVAVALHTQNLSAGLTEEESFEKLAGQVQAEMPHKFEGQRRPAAPAVTPPAAPGNRSGGGKKKGFDALPAEAKQTYDRLAAYWKAKGKTYSKEDYAKDYWINLEGEQ